MCSKEKYRFLTPNFSLPVEELTAKEMFVQFLFLDSGLADKKDGKTGVSLGLPTELAIRRNKLEIFILCALEEKVARKKVVRKKVRKVETA